MFENLSRRRRVVSGSGLRYCYWRVPDFPGEFGPTRFWWVFVTYTKTFIGVNENRRWTFVWITWTKRETSPKETSLPFWHHLPKSVKPVRGGCVLPGIESDPQVHSRWSRLERREAVQSPVRHTRPKGPTNLWTEDGVWVLETTTSFLWLG